MVFPNQSLDPFQVVNQVTSGAAGPQSGPWSGSGFNASIQPSIGGTATREAKVTNYRDARTTRQLMKFFVPEMGAMVEVYINPANVIYNHKKLITKTRTKGGFSTQYWGEDLSSLKISGSTGTSGWEGINVLYDIYRNEQLQFDAYALTIAAEKDKADQESFDSLLFGDSILGDIENIATNLKSAQKGYYNSLTQSRVKPTLASIAFGVELYYSGLVFRGYFDDFNVTEAAEHFSLFDYSFNFTVTQIRGYRSNNKAFQKSPVTGPSQSDIHKAHPSFSYGTLVNPISISNNIQTSIIDAFQVY